MQIGKPGRIGSPFVVDAIAEGETKREMVGKF
jgi:hypothetical protein